MFLLPPPDKDAFARICKAGRLLPQKSTYFYPKLATGLVMRSLDGEVFRPLCIRLSVSSADGRRSVMLSRCGLNPNFPPRSAGMGARLGGQAAEIFFLHSAANGGVASASGRQSRYSYFALDAPRYSAEAHDGTLNIRYHGDTAPRSEALKIGNPYDRFHGWLSRFSPPRTEALPPFWGGAVGYFSYDSAALSGSEAGGTLPLQARRKRPRSRSKNFLNLNSGFTTPWGSSITRATACGSCRPFFCPWAKPCRPCSLSACTGTPKTGCAATP